MATAHTIDTATGNGTARIVKPANGKIHLEFFTVAVVSW